MSSKILQRLLHRIAWVMPGGYSLRPGLHRLRGVTIGKKVWISQFVYIDELHPESVFIGDNTSIGLRSSIISHFYWGPRRASQHSGEVHIEEDVFIGPHCIILPKVRIGRGAVIQAGTVVSQNVPAGTYWAHQKAGPVARVTVPLTWEYSYTDFLRGLKPFQVKSGAACRMPERPAGGKDSGSER